MVYITDENNFYRPRNCCQMEYGSSKKNNMDPSSHSTNIIVFVVFPPDDPALFEGGGKACLSLMKHGERRQNANNIIEDKVFKLT